MSNYAIEVENLWKKYQLGEQKPYGMLRDILANPFKKDEISTEEFWALKDVSFKVKEGEVMGVIGKNGSGKSTLLKILTRITPPTKGQIKLRGRVASLLEVGTGFSPELTGRENIFLNGSILGMTKQEIKRKFDEIVDFSGVEKFIDTPVKRYSSGMYVRLAFAVAAHLESEILLVDEVLAVGDAEFQKKSVEKMNRVAKSGRTVLFVSHHISLIERLCPRTLLLKNGLASFFGSTPEAIAKYLTTPKGFNPNNQYPVKPHSKANILSVSYTDSHSKPLDRLYIDSDFFIEVIFNVNEALDNATLGIDFFANDTKLLVSSGADLTGKLKSYKSGQYQTRVKVPAFLFNVGSYRLEITLHNPYIKSYDRVDNVYLEILNRNNPRFNLYQGNIHGHLAINLDYKEIKM